MVNLNGKNYPLNGKKKDLNSVNKNVLWYLYKKWRLIHNVLVLKWIILFFENPSIEYYEV